MNDKIKFRVAASHDRAEPFGLFFKKRTGWFGGWGWWQLLHTYETEQEAREFCVTIENVSEHLK